MDCVSAPFSLPGGSRAAHHEARHCVQMWHDLLRWISTPCSFSSGGSTNSRWPSQAVGPCARAGQAWPRIRARLRLGCGTRLRNVRAPAACAPGAARRALLARVVAAVVVVIGVVHETGGADAARSLAAPRLCRLRRRGPPPLRRRRAGRSSDPGGHELQVKLLRARGSASGTRRSSWRESQEAAW